MEELKIKIERTTSPTIEILNSCPKRSVKKPSIENPFAFFIHDDARQIIAGYSGFIIYGSIYTDMLWVHHDHRKKGMGKQLMEKVHDYGQEMHCKIATVTTMNFQRARAFYEKLGYECDHVRSGYVGGATYIFLKKVL